MPTSRVKQNKKYSTVHRWNLSTKNPTFSLFHMLHDRTASLWGYMLAISYVVWKLFLVFHKAVWIIAMLTFSQSQKHAVRVGACKTWPQSNWYIEGKKKFRKHQLKLTLRFCQIKNSCWWLLQSIKLVAKSSFSTADVILKTLLNFDSEAKSCKAHKLFCLHHKG